MTIDKAKAAKDLLNTLGQIDDEIVQLRMLMKTYKDYSESETHRGNVKTFIGMSMNVYGHDVSQTKQLTLKHDELSQIFDIIVNSRQSMKEYYMNQLNKL